MGPKTLGAKRETQGERSLSPPRWSSTCGSGRRLQLWGSRLFGTYWRSLPELSEEPMAVVAVAPGAAVVTLRPAPQWIPARAAGRRLHQAQIVPTL
uniref:Uncharacterized protein n=1 Tax=Mus musculus TaxID=10090 RepID=Q3TDW7_MOUSE|nr:unnamed protein product [Mus musculus]BAE41481.1 unnamed protein product [Mus musculus]